MKKGISVFFIFLVITTLFGCKKDNGNDNPQPFDGNDTIAVLNEDLSYLIETYSRHVVNNTVLETVTTYDGYKITSRKHYHNGQLSAEQKNFYYEGLDASHDSYSYHNYDTNDVSIHQHFSIEYLDTTYYRWKRTINEFYYAENSNVENKVEETIFDYEGIKEVGYRRYINGILVIQVNDFVYDGLNCSYTYKKYSNSGNLEYTSRYEIQYLDSTYLRQKVTRYTTEYVDGSPNSVYYKIVQYDGKKQMGYKVFVDGKLTEEGRDYLYDGLKCYYSVDHYRDGTLSDTATIEVHYLE